ncbi:MAG TPA: Hsp70 family protein, partial [Pseudomonadales bacterium]|nr:Hsp70 family protein [Pseudomonadales bacterium]
KWVGEVEYRGADMFYVTDVYAYVDELMPGRLLQYIKTALRTEGFDGTLVFDRYYTTGEVIKLYLQALKQRAETLLGDAITGVTLGRPVKFSNKPDQDQKSQETLRQAALEAGFEKVQYELEPVAAALYYEQTLHQAENVLIFDFGGGTLDITIMRLGDRSRKVYASGGIDIAGSDFDRTIIQKRMLRHFGKGRIDHRHDIMELVNAVSDWMVLPELSLPKARLKLTQAILEGEAPVQLKALETLIFNDLAFSFYNTVEAAKINLSNQGASTITLQEKDIDIWELYTRNQFERDIHEYKNRIEQVLYETIAASGLDPQQIDAVVKTGGSSNIPVFGEMLGGIFGPERVKSSNAFSSVTAGLGIRANQAI